MRKVHFSTPQQVAQYLRMTIETIEGGNVPDDLREVAFTSVFAALTGAQVFFDQADAEGPIARGMAIPQSKGH